jgi:NitT/TauT family transport system ATP-binding protein
MSAALQLQDHARRRACTFTARTPRPTLHRRQDVSLTRGRGRVRQRGRPHRLRQEHAAECGRRAAGAQSGQGGGVWRTRWGINRRAGYMFQTESLMPWRTALANVMAGLEFRGVPLQQAPGPGPGVAAPRRVWVVLATATRTR